MEKHEAHGGSLEPGDVRAVLFCSSMDHEVLECPEPQMLSELSCCGFLSPAAC